MVKQIENFKISECRKIVFFDVQKLVIRCATIFQICSKVIFKAMIKTFKIITSLKADIPNYRNK